MISETNRAILAAAFGLLHLAFVIGLTLWGRRVAARRGTRAWRIASWMPLMGVASTLVGIAGTAYGLNDAFGPVAQIDPSTRAARVADGIRIAMIWTAAGLGLAITLYVASVVAFFVGGRLPPRATS